MAANGEKRYADAVEAVRGVLEHMPDHPGLHYNYACFATLAGDTGDDTFAHLRRSVELLPRFREAPAETTTLPPYATTRGSRKLFAEGKGPRPLHVGGSSRRSADRALPLRYARGTHPAPRGGLGERRARALTGLFR